MQLAFHRTGPVREGFPWRSLCCGRWVAPWRCGTMLPRRSDRDRTNRLYSFSFTLWELAYVGACNWDGEQARD